jgi:preprotein translocase subunit YajC
METNNRGKLISIIVLILIIIIVVIVYKNVDESKKEQEKKDTVNQTNYWVNENGGQVNTSQNIDETKIVGDLSIEKSEIVRENGISTLTAKVINNGSDKSNLKLKVKFLANDSSVITETNALVGNIKSGQTRYINAGFPADVSNAKNIVYEVVN